MRDRGGEFGTTTGRPRRCGWFDAVAVRHCARSSGLDELAITKLDILSGLEVLKVGTAYADGDARISTFPADVGTLERISPVYEEFPGFSEDISDVRRFEDLPAAAQRYLVALQDLVGVPIRLVSVGPEREQVIRRD
jgi:adenylosuccinate synthase